MIRARLMRESEGNVAFRITETGACRMHGYPTELQVLPL